MKFLHYIYLDCPEMLCLEKNPRCVSIYIVLKFLVVKSLMSCQKKLQYKQRSVVHSVAVNPLSSEVSELKLKYQERKFSLFNIKGDDRLENFILH